MLEASTGDVLQQYGADIKSGTNCPLQSSLFVYNRHGTMPFVRKSLNLIFPPEKLDDIRLCISY